MNNRRSILFCISFILLSGCVHKEPPLEQPGEELISQNVESNAKGEKSSPKDITTEPIRKGESGITIQKDGKVSNELMDLAQTKLALLPSNVKDAFLNDGWDIILTDMDLNLTFYNGKYTEVLGNTIYGEGIIYIKSDEQAVNQAILHEIGHWLDFHLGYVTDSDEFRTIFEKEANSYIQNYQTTCVRNPKELFAETFWQYVENPQKLEILNPKLYWFMKDTVENTKTEPF